MSSHSTSTVGGFNKKSWTVDGSQNDEEYLVAKIQKIQLYLQKVLHARGSNASGLPSFLPIVKNASNDGVFAFSLKLKKLNLSEQRKVAAALEEFWKFLRDSAVSAAKSATSDEDDSSMSSSSSTTTDEDIIQLKSVTWMDCAGPLDELFLPILTMDVVEECTFIRVPFDEVDKQEDANRHKSSGLLGRELQSSWSSMSPERKKKEREDEPVAVNRLKVLRFDRCDIARPASRRVQRILSGSCNLESFDFKNGCLMQDYGDAVVPISKGFVQNKSLKYVNLEWSSLWDGCLQRLIQGLWHHPTLQDLDLTGNKSREKTMNALAALLQNSPSLNKLSLREQSVEWQGQLDIGTLVEALPTSKTLRHLDISVNYLNDKVMQELSKAWRKLYGEDDSSDSGCKLEELDIRCNRITDEGLAALMKKAKSLRKIHVQNNPLVEMKKSTVDVLCKTANTYFQLEYVGFSMTTENKALAKRLQNTISMNVGGQRARHLTGQDDSQHQHSEADDSSSSASTLDMVVEESPVVEQVVTEGPVTSPLTV